MSCPQALGDHGVEYFLRTRAEWYNQPLAGHTRADQSPVDASSSRPRQAKIDLKGLDEDMWTILLRCRGVFTVDQRARSGQAWRRLGGCKPAGWRRILLVQHQSTRRKCSAAFRSIHSRRAYAQCNAALRLSLSSPPPPSRAHCWRLTVAVGREGPHHRDRAWLPGTDTNTSRTATLKKAFLEETRLWLLWFPTLSHVAALSCWTLHRPSQD
ncbi:hypothetical protein EXIGLDRAFT_150928 [Exidia glandulosa HHB12029]|uniref:Uncharacterized protein n=1 Tax=Exidia glandulosa HHB12029 TaxID=1314781 RepID=A0A165FKS3_EXIGL|nr:hypothetical protein EXIGLDRAFT_150928 [Exidia glandulosa HHB12029]